MRVARESQPVTGIADALEPLVDAGEVARLVASDGLRDTRTAQAPAYMGGSPEMSVVDR